MFYDRLSSEAQKLLKEASNRKILKILCRREFKILQDKKNCNSLSLTVKELWAKEDNRPLIY